MRHPSERMAASSAQAITTASEDFQVRLDYSLESIARLEEILGRQAAASQQEPISQERLQDLVTMWGSYLGEVVCRLWDGHWMVPEDGPFKNAICVVARGYTICPASRVQKRLMEGESASVWSYVNALEHMLSGNHVGRRRAAAILFSLIVACLMGLVGLLAGSYLWVHWGAPSKDPDDTDAYFFGLLVGGVMAIGGCTALLWRFWPRATAKASQSSGI